MKYAFSITAFLLLFLASCGSDENKKNVPDVSNIKLSVKIARFDQDIIAIDTNQLDAGMEAMAQKYPMMFPLFVSNIIHDQTNPNENPKDALSGFLRAPQVRAVFDTCTKVFKDVSDLENDLTQMFKYYKYYFPEKPTPQVVSMVSEFATDAFTASDSLCGIGLDLFLGENYAGYNPEIFPDYIRRQFTPNYIPVRLAKALATDIVGQSSGKRLIDRMIQNGKMLYVTDCLLPFTADSLKLGYTQAQVDGCYFNEAEAWARILDQKLLYSTEFDKWRKLVTPSPNAPVIYTEAPGEMGNWIGLRILQSYMKRHPNTKMQDLLAITDVQKLLEAAKYKPKRK
jgi:hypothetical protein